MSPDQIHYVPFSETGAFIDRAGLETFLAQVSSSLSPTDLFIFCHGWNNSFADASATYAGVLRQMTRTADATPGLRPDPFRPLALGVIWPSKSWDESASETEGVQPMNELPPNIAEIVYENLSPERASDAGFRHDVMRVLQLAGKNRLRDAERQEFCSLLRRHADRPSLAEDHSIFDGTGGAAELEGAAGDFSARDVLRVFTYWQMKKRAGLVGEVGVRALLGLVQARFPAARVHLLGHSFGCKVVLATVAGPGPPPPAPVETLVLLQGAVSYEALADTVTGTDSPGGYRAALENARVAGRIVATFSQLDQACSRAYPLGSRLGSQVGELEGIFDRYRALGAVGAFGIGGGLGSFLTMQNVGSPYAFGRHGVWSVDGGTTPANFITGHSVIQTPQIAWLIWHAVKRQ